MVEVRLGPFVAKDILKMIRAKWTAVFPLRITSAVAFAYCDPTMPADRLALSHIRLFEPRNHQRRFRFELPMRHVVVGQCEVKWILLWNERDGDVITTVGFVGAIKAAITRGPVEVPGATIIRHRVISAGLFTDPENSGHDVTFPGETLDRGSGTGRDKHLRFNLEQGLLPQLHRVLGKVSSGRVRGTRLLFCSQHTDGAGQN